MTVLFDINHPAHVHVFKNVIYKLHRDGNNKCWVMAREKEVTQRLLAAYSISYISTGIIPATTTGKFLKGLISIFQLVWIIVLRRVNLVVSMESPYAVAAAWLCRRKSITIADTEEAGLIHKVTGPLSTVMLVPECFQKKISKNQVTFKGYKELAYLHPDRFNPDQNVLARNGMPVDIPFAVIRFVAFKAMHDRGKKGFSREYKVKLVKLLLEKVNVYISSEIPLPAEREAFMLKCNPADIHHILSFSSLFVGESTTMAAEAAVLGVPSICVNDAELGYISELSDKYGLIFKYNGSPENQDAAIEKAVEISGQPGIREEWQRRRLRMLEDKIDVTSFLLEKIYLH